MNTRRALLESVEPRRLLSFTTLDTAFGNGGVVNGGVVQIDTDVGSDNLQRGPTHLTPIGDGRLVLADNRGIHYYRGDGVVDLKRGSSGYRNLYNISDPVMQTAVRRQGPLRRDAEHRQWRDPSSRDHLYVGWTRHCRHRHHASR
jgi:hypothetical protein